MNTLAKVMICCSILLVQSCAAIFKGSNQEVEVIANVPGAEVFVDGVKKCSATPCTFKVKRNDKEHTYVIKKAGYYDYQYTDQSKSGFGLLMVLDLMALYVPLIVDYAVGANKSFNERVVANLNAKEIIKEKEIVYVGRGASAYDFKRNADIDKDVPVNTESNSLRFAMIIGNEDYASQQSSLSAESNVDFARNDASAFKEYAMKTLGIPEKNIVFELDATTGKMNQGLTKINLLCKNTDGQAEIYFYYAGHGLPAETTKEPYLIPVDVSGSNVEAGIKLSDVYSKLTEYPSKHVVAVIDACFSGGARNQGLFSARGVKVVPKSIDTHGKLIVLTASSDEQSSLPLKEKEHGLFTYYLLKKIQETNGNIALKELFDFVKQKVAVESLLMNNKEQTPQAIFNSEVADEWKKWKLK
jgi:hypothetical protein